MSDEGKKYIINGIIAHSLPGLVTDLRRQVDELTNENARLLDRIAELEHQLVAAQSYRQDYAQAVDQMLAAERRVAELEEFARECSQNFDCDSAGREHPNYCRKCNAAALLEKPQ